MHFEKITRNQWYRDFDWCDNVDLTDEAYNAIKLPTRATERSAGYDFFAPEDFIIPPKCTLKIPTGIRWVCNKIDGYKVLLIAPRSGLGFRYGVRLINTIGVVDADFCEADNEGHIHIKLYNPSNESINIKRGEAFAQGIITQFCTCDDDEATGNRTGGFGSTNR